MGMFNLGIDVVRTVQDFFDVLNAIDRKLTELIRIEQEQLKITRANSTNDH